MKFDIHPSIPRRPRAFTLAELIIGLLLLAIIGAATAAVAAAVSRGWQMGEANHTSTVTITRTMLRIQDKVQRAKVLGRWRAGSVAADANVAPGAAILFWRDDANGDGKMQMDETQLLEYDPHANALLVHELEFPDPVTRATNNGPFDSAMLHEADAINDYKGMKYLKTYAITNDVLGAEFNVITPSAASQRPSVEFQLRFKGPSGQTVEYRDRLAAIAPQLTRAALARVGARGKQGTQGTSSGVGRGWTARRQNESYGVLRRLRYEPHCPTLLAPHAAAARGVALLLVLGVVVMASVLGYAMLSSAAMTKQTNTNAAVTATSQGVAESGVNLALYYLQNPESAPTYPATYPGTEQYDRQWKFWTGTNGQFIDLGSPSIGQVNVSVRRPNAANRWEYEIEAKGRAPNSTLERTVVARTHVNAEFRFDHAALTSSDVGWTGNTRIEGDAYSNAGLTIRSGGQIIGKGIRRRILATAVTPTLGWQSPAPIVPKVIPTFDEVRSYLTYEMPAGTVNNATVLSATQLGRGGLLGLGGSAQTFEPTTSNPAGIYYAPGDLTINSDVEFRGTLIVRGNLSIVGNNVWIHSKPGYPALVVGGNVNFGGLLTLVPAARVEGVMYVAGRVDATGLLPTLEVEGAMLVGGTQPVFISLPLSYLRVKYNRELATVPDFSQVGRTPISVKVLEWQAR